MCPGEAYAKMMMFVYFAAILKNFDIVSPKTQKIPGIRDIVYGLGNNL